MYLRLLESGLPAPRLYGDGLNMRYCVCLNFIEDLNVGFSGGLRVGNVGRGLLLITLDHHLFPSRQDVSGVSRTRASLGTLHEKSFGFWGDYSRKVGVEESDGKGTALGLVCRQR